ncbi:MAG TPA: ATP-binding protein [Steroidobacteraceae bacterium]|nr:ATP-binding protein [Steroidobacteraceae bacterium]
MDVKTELKPGQDFLIALLVSVLGSAAIFSAPSADFPILHTMLNTGIALGIVMVSLLFSDLGWRTGEVLVRYLAIVFAVTGVLEVMHVLDAPEPSTGSEWLNDIVRRLQISTWGPPAYLLPLGITAAFLIAPQARFSSFAFGIGTIVVALGLLVLFQVLPRYSEPGWFGITRPSLSLVPLAWIPVGVILWRRWSGDRIVHALGYYGLGVAVAHAFMMFSDQSASKFAMVAHFGVCAFGINLLLNLMHMGTADNARRARIEHQLKVSNEALEARVRARTLELEALNADLRREVGVRHDAEVRTLMQLERLDLLRRITHAIAERHDLASIFHVMVRSVEEHLPVDFAVLCDYQKQSGALTVSCVGARSEQLAIALDMSERARIEIDQNGLSRCVSGEQVYEPDISAVDFPFPQRLHRGGLRSMVAVPLMVERGNVLAVLIVAGRNAQAFSSGQCEFLRQLCDHVALAANHAQLHASLQQAYADLRRTQNAVLEQERLRALGQMASGIAHDINNAISPAAVYVDAILEHEAGFSERTRKQLEVVRGAVDDVAKTVARMGEFYRRKPALAELASVRMVRVLREILELTRARWSDMAQQRGVFIETAVESMADDTTVMVIESELREALVNLVLNAIDAMPEGGKLTLRAGRIGAAVDPASRVFIEVSDTGTGMDEETRRRCLEPFFTTKGERGSGLGLAMVYGITQRHEAEIDIISAPGAGSTFRITFPPPKPAARPTAVARTPKVPGKTRILLIDDDPLLLASLRDVLVGEGHEVETAQGGKAGIEAFLAAQQAGRTFPVVLTDLGMPHVDGRVVAATIAAASPSTPIIMLTGWGQRLVATGDVLTDVVAVMSKPPNIAELRERLAQCIGERAQ